MRAFGVTRFALRANRMGPTLKELCLPDKTYPWLYMNCARAPSLCIIMETHALAVRLILTTQPLKKESGRISFNARVATQK